MLSLSEGAGECVWCGLGLVGSAGSDKHAQWPSDEYVLHASKLYIC